MEYQTLEYRVYPNGTQEYCRDGKRHRDNGPAVIWADGSQEYFRDDVEFTKEEFYAKPCAGKVIEVEGVKYRLTPL